MGGGRTLIFPCGGGNLEAPPSHADPRDGPGKVCPGKKKIGGSGCGGSRGRSPGGAGSGSSPHPLRPAPASSLEGAGARPRAPASPGGAGPGPARKLGALDAAGGEECGTGGAAGGGQGARLGGEEGRERVASAPGRAGPGRRRAPACAHRAGAEGRHPLPGRGGGPRQARGRERGRGAPAGGRVTRSSPFPLSLPVADAAAPAAPRAEDWTAEPRAAAAAERPPRMP